MNALPTSSVILVVALALGFDYINGFHDAANSIATVVSTRVLSPRMAVASLFDGGIDPMVVIRWKDLFERLEAAIDAAERVANIIEGIVIKNS